MAKYSLVINSKFNPFSYQELLAPVQQSTQAHQMVEAQFGELAQKADAWKAAAMANPNSRAASMYQGYANDLDTQARRLSAEGLTSSSRQSALDMYRRYSSEILPIENAYKLRADDIKRQNDMIDKDDSIMWNRSASTASLDDYLDGNSPEYYHVSGKNLCEQAMAEATAESSRYFRTEEGRRFNGDILDFIQKTGYSREEAMDIMAQAKDANGKYLYPQFNDIVSRVKNTSKYDSLDIVDKKRADNYIFEGINLGLKYDEKHSPTVNWRAQSNLNFAHQKELENLKHQNTMEEIRARGEASDKTTPTLTGASVFGNVGKPYDDSRFKGLAVLDDGTFINSKVSDLTKQSKELTQKLSKYSDEEVASFREYKKYLEEVYTKYRGEVPRSEQKAKPRGYDGYSLLTSKINNIESKKYEESKYLEDLAKSYSYLGKESDYENLMYGIALEQAKSKQQLAAYTINNNSTISGHITKKLAELSSLSPKEFLDNNTAGIARIDINGNLKDIDYGDVQTLKKADSITPVVLSNGKLAFAVDNKYYTMDFFDPFKRASAELTRFNNYLSDFSSESIREDNTIDMSIDHLADIIQSGTISPADLGVEQGNKMLSRSIDRSGNYTDLVVNTGNDLYKILLRRTGMGYAVVGYSSLNDEISGGNVRSQQYMDMAGRILGDVNKALGE